MEQPLLLFLSLIFFSLFSLSTPLPTQAILDGAQVLSDSGYVSMALTLELVSDTLASQSPSITIFSPSDEAFLDSGQPSLTLLQLHFSPLAFSFESLRSLPYGTKIPTMSSGKSLAVTTSDSDTQVALRNVTINGSPIYDDGSLIIFGIDKFFDPNFEVIEPVQSPIPDPRCLGLPEISNFSNGANLFDDVSDMLRSRGYSVMASFLDLQLLQFLDRPKLTVFAPIDNVIVHLISNFSEYSSIFLRHVVPCTITWAKLTNFEDGTTLRTYSEGFTIKITKSNDLLTVNEIPVTFPDMYHSDWLVVHGLHEVLEPPVMPPETAPEVVENLSRFRRKMEVVSPHRTEF